MRVLSSVALLRSLAGRVAKCLCTSKEGDGRDDESFELHLDDLLTIQRQLPNLIHRGEGCFCLLGIDT